MSNKFIMKAQEVKPEGRRLIGCSAGAKHRRAVKHRT